LGFCKGNAQDTNLYYRALNVTGFSYVFGICPNPSRV
jgi:hypothetical protein